MRKLLIIIIVLANLSCNQNQNMKNDNLKNEYIKALKEFKWQTDFEKIESLLKPAIRINQKTSIKESHLGISKFGGTPDLPTGMDWPKFEGRPMIFLAQINLDEIKQYDFENELPDKGIVYFFIHFNEPENEFGTEYQFIFDKKEYKVIYSESAELQNVDFPEELIAEYHFKPTRMEFQPFFTFPSRETLEIESLVDEDQENSYSFNDSYGNHEGEQILGYTMPIQYDVTWDWAFSYLDFKTYELTDTDKAKIDSIRPDFVTLLQFSLENSYTGFEKIGISIGYFGITKKDLKNKDFDNTILIFQDT